MASAPGLHNIRLPGPPVAANDGQDIIVEMSQPTDAVEVDDSGKTIQINHGDGSVTISLDGSDLSEPDEQKPTGWFDNLVEKIGDLELQRISNDLLRGIDSDIESRKEWIEDRAVLLKLLGLKVEIPGLQGASDGAPVEGMSKVRHPLLLEAVLRFQANARAELLPTDGPVKVRDDTTGAPPSAVGDTPDNDRLADALEDDLNHYLTAVATEYIPDTDRMLLMLGLGGTAFKKVYFCPLRNRPVSETVDAPDLIVDNAATDLANAKRVTHKVMMRPSTVKRMQILGVYRDIDLSQPMAPKLDSLDREKNAQQGISPETMFPEDRDREIYECYCELNIDGFEHRYKGKPSGLEIPYRVTIDLSSKEILSVVRDYNQPQSKSQLMGSTSLTPSEQLPKRRKTFVKYTFVPGFGFYDIGLGHILGNTTNALTAAWRLMLDNGMFANFPGFLISKMGTRQNTNIFRIPPGGGAPIDTAGQDIRTAVMPLPYNTSGQAALQALENEMAQTGMRVGGTSEQQVGEGRADAPVGTTIAMIEQAKIVLNSVHKRMHSSQAEELQLIVHVFKEHPESFVEMDCPSQTQWQVQTFLTAVKDCNLVPQADPNTASHGQRMAKLQGLKMLQAASPNLYDPLAIDKAVLQGMGWSNPDQFFVPIQAQGNPPPELLEKQAKAQADGKRADASMITAQARAAESQAKVAGLGAAQAPEQQPPPDPLKIEELKLKAQAQQIEAHDDAMEAENRERDRESNERIEAAKLIATLSTDPQAIPEAEKMMEPGFLKALETDEPPIVGGEESQA